MAIRSVLSIGIQLIGDGVSTSFTFDITKGPLNLNVGGNNPSGVQLAGGSPPGASISLSGTKVTVNVANASDLTPQPGTGPFVTISFLLLFPGM